MRVATVALVLSLLSACETQYRTHLEAARDAMFKLCVTYDDALAELLPKASDRQALRQLCRTLGITPGTPGAEPPA